MARAINSDLDFISYQCDTLSKLAEDIIDYNGGLSDETCNFDLEMLQRLKGVEGVLRAFIKQGKGYIKEDHEAEMERSNQIIKG